MTPRTSSCTASACPRGIAIGHAHLVSGARLEVAHYEIPEATVPRRERRFDAAIARRATS